MYKYNVIDKAKKEIYMIEVSGDSCQRQLEKKLCEEYKLDVYDFQGRIRLEFNGQDEDFAHLSKKYSKFKKVER